ncbi:putative WD40 repeat-containing protein [Rosellinia necatrix]|uniref:Putative WD40 repeat-containing protein n=1 Tax=Rosellinia necatrix TaxID=77044 RepID=A0A1S7UMV4_ROSNE|nr:putative WD40 repeat-containing protein [Rosellinia necatrix]
MACDNIEQGWQIPNHDLLKDKAQIDGAVVNSPMCLAFNGDRTQVGVSYRGAPLSVWGLHDGQCIHRCTWHPMTDENIEAKLTADEIAASPNGKLFATSSSDGSIRVWDFAYFSVIYQLSSENLVTDLTFSPDSRRFYDLRDGAINTWESNSLTRFLEMDEHISDSNSEDQSSTTASQFSEQWAEQFEAVSAFALAPDGSSYCVGYEDGNVEY